MRRRVGVFLGSILIAGSPIVACSGANSSSGAGGGAASGNGGSGALNTGGNGNINVDGGGGSGGIPQGCATESHNGELSPLDMYLMLDQSASMQDSGKWGSVTGAINQFVALPNLTKLGMGLALFPTPASTPIPTTCTTDPDCGFYGPCVPVFGCNGALAAPDSCLATDYQNAVVPIADLPGVGPTITQNIPGTPNGNSTPMSPALERATFYAINWAAAHPDHITVVVLATDGEPNNCNPNSVPVAADHAATALANNPSIKTFVIGVGDLAALNAIAAAGGTGQAILVSAGNAGQEFLDALNRSAATWAASTACPPAPRPTRTRSTWCSRPTAPPTSRSSSTCRARLSAWASWPGTTTTTTRPRRSSSVPRRAIWSRTRRARSTSCSAARRSCSSAFRAVGGKYDCQARQGDAKRASGILIWLPAAEPRGPRRGRRREIRPPSAPRGREARQRKFSFGCPPRNRTSAERSRTAP
jgi:hypothetical protein